MTNTRTQSNLRLLISRNKREGKRRKVFIKRFFKMIGSDISWFEYVPALSRRKVKS